MQRKMFLCLALLGLSSASASAQQPVAGYAQPLANGVAVSPVAVPANVPHVQAPAAFARPVSAGAVAVGAPAPGPVAVVNQPAAVVPQTVVHPVPVAPGPGQLSAVAPQRTVAVSSAWAHSASATPAVTRQTQVYTPTYYYYYYQPPYQVTHVTPVYTQPMAIPYAAGNVAGGYQAAGPFGPMMNNRGEMGHIRLPYYSYRRPWYYPGQPSFNVTIPGPVW